MSATVPASQPQTERSSSGQSPPGPAPDLDMVWIPGGEFTMGSNDHYPEEAPAHRAAVSGFWIDRTQVTNAAFRRFVKDSGYVTVAERVPDAAMYPGALPEMLVAGSVVFRQPPGRVPMHTHYNWWDWMPGADWVEMEGAGHCPQLDLPLPAAQLILGLTRA